MPSPHEELCRLLGSPLPTHTTEGSEGAIAMSPMVETPSLSKTGSQLVPLFVVFQTPPEAVPTYTMLGLPSTTAKSSMRPPITAGPISRNSRFLNLSVGLCGSPGAAVVCTSIATRNAPQARNFRRALDVCFISSPYAQGRASYSRRAADASKFLGGATIPCQDRRAAQFIRFTSW